MEKLRRLEAEKLKRLEAEKLKRLEAEKLKRLKAGKVYTGGLKCLMTQSNLPPDPLPQKTLGTCNLMHSV